MRLSRSYCNRDVQRFHAGIQYEIRNREAEDYGKKQPFLRKDKSPAAESLCKVVNFIFYTAPLNKLSLHFL